MLKCNYCGEIFEDPKILRDYHNELDGSPYEEIPVCPWCRDADIEKVHKCKVCGNYDSSLTAGACAACRVEILARFRNLLLQFTGAEKEVLNELYDGECF